jgi:hypothetical protein
MQEIDLSQPREAQVRQMVAAIQAAIADVQVKLQIYLSHPTIQEMPENEAGIKNGSIIIANKNMAEHGLVGVVPGSFFMLAWNGESIKGGGVTIENAEFGWSLQALSWEILQQKWWTLVDNPTDAFIQGMRITAHNLKPS